MVGGIFSGNMHMWSKKQTFYFFTSIHSSSLFFEIALGEWRFATRTLCVTFVVVWTC